MAEPTITFARSLELALAQRGLELDGLARAAGLGPEVFDARRRLPMRSYAQLLRQAVDELDEPTLGLQIGAELRPELFGVVGNVALKSATLGDAFAVMSRYKRLVAPERLELEVVGDELRLSFSPEDPDWPRARVHADAELAFLISFARRLTAAPLRTRALHLRGPEPVHVAAYQELFGASLVFEQPLDALVFDASVLARPLLSADAELCTLLKDRAERELALLPESEAIEHRVEAQLVRLLPHGEPSLDEVAAALGMSARSLQRRLGERERSFRQLLHTTRRTLAREYLRRDDLDTADVAFLLGFGHVQSFYRAFRRWTGQTPDSFRRHALS